MDTDRFDRLSRTVSLLVSRRSVTGALGLGAIAIPGLAEGRKNHKKRKKKKKIRRNGFGCVNVGNFCKSGDQCCSGICQGKKGKKKCQPHDASTCAGQDGCADEFVPCTIKEFTGTCAVTTGNASYCAVNSECVACAKDTDCEALCGAGAACIVCAECVVAGLQTACASTTEEGCQPG
jgi:hypothetical protein